METRELGRSGLRVSAIGLGCMPMSQSYGEPDPELANPTLSAALDAGIDFFDTADAYGWGHNEKLLGSWLGSERDQE
ncbi:MAG: aldo/keto reductase [Pseudomonadota bacterium]